MLTSVVICGKNAGSAIPLIALLTLFTYYYYLHFLAWERHSTCEKQRIGPKVPLLPSKTRMGEGCSRLPQYVKQTKPNDRPSFLL